MTRKKSTFLQKSFEICYSDFGNRVADTNTDIQLLLHFVKQKFHPIPNRYKSVSSTLTIAGASLGFITPLSLTPKLQYGSNLYKGAN